VFYIGYGKNNRHLDHLKEANKEYTKDKNSHKINTIKKLLREGKSPSIQKLVTQLAKEEAIELEEFLIAEIGRHDLNTGPLTNLTQGGEGNRGWSPAQRDKMSKQQKDYIQAKDPVTNTAYRVKKDDPRWVSGELVGQNSGINRNIGTILKDYILAKDPVTNTVYRVKKDDPRWVSGELVGINKGKPCHPNTIKAAKMKKGIPKSIEHRKKAGNTIKQLKWYCNFETDQVRRFKESEQPDGYVRVSGPHKRTPV